MFQFARPRQSGQGEAWKAGTFKVHEYREIRNRTNLNAPTSNAYAGAASFSLVPRPKAALPDHSTRQHSPRVTNVVPQCLYPDILHLRIAIIAAAQLAEISLCSLIIPERTERVVLLLLVKRTQANAYAEPGE